MSALDQILPARAPVASPFTGEVIDRDDPKALAAALAEIEVFLEELYGKHGNVYRARNEIKARLGEISPTDLPARRSQTEKQAKIDRCPRCRTRLPQVQIIEDSEPEPSVQPEARAGANPVRGADSLDVAGPASSGSEKSEPLPQEAQNKATSTDAPAAEGGEEARDGASSPLNPIVVQAGEIVIPQGKRAGRTVADVAEHDPDWCLWYLEAGKTETLKAAITTYLFAVKPQLMEGK